MHVNDIWIAGGPQCGAVEMQWNTEMCKSRIDITYSLGCLGLENDFFFKFDLYTPQQFLNH